MALRWMAAGMLEAERQFRRVTGHRDLACIALEREPARQRSTQTPIAEAGAPANKRVASTCCKNPLYDLCGAGEAHFYQPAYALIRTSPFDTSTVPGAQTWIGFTHEYSGWLVVSVTFSRS